jgi:hypothetical protein
MLSSNKFGASQSSSRALHIFGGERLQTFSDAVFAIIATLMVGYETRELQTLQICVIGALYDSPSTS